LLTKSGLLITPRVFDQVLGPKNILFGLEVLCYLLKNASLLPL